MESTTAGNSEELVVTGSRVRRRIEEATSPIVTVNSDSIQARGLTNTVDVLSQLPQMGATTISDTSSNFANDTAGIAAINLRNLGNSRTLVLIDGRRTVGSIPPGQPGGSAVDVSQIPAFLIDSVDVVTGGGSSSYGSEAVAGVVNIMLRKRYDGILVNSQYGLSGHGDGNTWTTDLLAGTHFADDRGHILFAGEYQKKDVIYSRDRAISRYDTFNGVYTPSSYNLDGYYLTRLGGAVVPLADGTVVPYSSEYGYNRDGARTLQIPTKKLNFYTKFDYDLTPDINIFGSARFSYTKANTLLEPASIGATYTIGYTNVLLGIPADNAFIPAALAALQPTTDASGNLSGWRGRFGSLGQRGGETTRYIYSLTGGFQGTIAGRFNWEAFYSHGVTDSSFRGTGYNLINLQNALRTAVVDGQIVCASAEARAQGCAPYNPFGAGNASAAAVNYVYADKTYDDNLKQDDLQATINGPLFDLPAGSVRLALGVEHRRESGSNVPDYLTQQGLSSGTQGPSTFGRYHVTDLFAETVIPLLRNRPFFENLSVEAGYRYSQYSLNGVGGQHSYKYGLTWAPINDIRLRASNSLAIRAPNITELYQGRSQYSTSVTDPCSARGLTGATNQAARIAACSQIPGLTPGFTELPQNQQGQLGYLSGNPNLSAEKAHVLTAGLVLTPRFLRRFTLQADFFRYNIKDAIQSIDIQTTANLCIDTGLPLYCSLVRREPDTGLIDGIDSQVINVGSIKQKGVDVTANYQLPVGSLSAWLFKRGSERGAVDLSLNYEHIFSQNYTAAGIKTDQTGLFGVPRHKGNMSVNYHDDVVMLNYQFRLIGRQRYAYTIGPHIPVYTYHDISLRYKIVKALTAYTGVNNLFDKKPPLVDQSYANSGAGVVSGVYGTETVPQVYDVIGRYFYFGVKLEI